MYGKIYLIFCLTVFWLSGCLTIEKPKAAKPPIVSKPQIIAELGTLQDPIVDSNITLAQALRKYAPADFKARQTILDVLYYSFDGKVHKGQVVIEKQLAEDIREVFRVALESKFPIKSAIPISSDQFYSAGQFNSDDQSMLANNTAGFNYRKVTDGKKLSMHAYGFAIDINPRQNPYIKGKTVLPEGAVFDPSQPGTLNADSAVVMAFKRLGWTWGGDWKSLKDYQHFEKRP